jgi:HAE1 family hydrophobic/amphiphilic exporter-1
MANHGGGLSGVAIRRPVFTTMMMLGLVVLGIFSFRRLAVDEFPDIDIPVVTVQTIYPGASPETMEREVSRRLEEAFNPVEGVNKITSTSLEGVSLVVVEFDLKRDGDAAAQDIRTKIDAVRRDLPTDIEPPLVQKFDPAAMPIMSLSLSSKAMPIVDLTTLADETVRRRLESISGVGEVRITGGVKKEVRVYVQPDRLQAVGVSIPEVMRALQSQNLEIPAGRLEQGASEQLVRVMGRITDARQFGEVIVATRNGQPVRLKDVARVEEGHEEERSLALANDQRAVGVEILKVSGANTVAVAEKVNKAVAELRPQLPHGTELNVVRDNAVRIKKSVDDVIHELLLGAFLTIVVVMLFLNDWKATAITSMALPVSVISAFILQSALGFTLNMMTLMALSLSIGILIDDAIVVIENIMRHREMGRDHFTAAGVGTREIVLAVLATTLSIAAVFVPVAFMGGIVGRFFYQFGITVAWAVMVSLFVSFTLTPMLSAWWGVEPHHGDSRNANFVTRGIVAFNRWFDNQAEKYRGVVGWALNHRKSTLGIAAAAFVGSFMLFPLIGGGFMPNSDNSEFVVQFETPEGSSLTYTGSKAEQVVNTVRAINGVDYTYTSVGSGPTGAVTKGEVYVKLVPAKDRKQSQQEVMGVARRQLGALYGLKVSVLNSGGVGGAQAPLQVEIHGPDANELQRLAGVVMKEMGQIHGVVDIKSSMGEPRPEYRISVHRDVANEVGLDIGQIAGTVRPFMAGQTATRWEDPTGEEREVVVQIDPTQRVSAADLERLPLAVSKKREGGAAFTVPLGAVAKVEQGYAPAQIDRKSLQRVATLSASTTPDLSIAEASKAIRERVATLEMPPGYSVGLGGETERMMETMGYVIEAIMLAVILIFLILASQFESFTQPFAIMLSLPLSLIGVLLALLFTRDTLNMMSMIGLIMLMGLVTKNAILLVDNANERRRSGTDRTLALIEAGAVRLRPIMMTTLAMIFGMLPIAMALGEGGGFRAPMARAVIGGLITSTALTLVVVPVAYTYFDDIGRWVKGKLVSSSRLDQIRAEQEQSGLVPEPVGGD